MTAEHWTLIAAIIGGIALQLASAKSWSDVLTTSFVAGFLLQVAASIRLLFVGSPSEAKKEAKAEKDLEMANASTKAALQTPIDTTKVDPKRYLGSDDVNFKDYVD